MVRTHIASYRSGKDFEDVKAGDKGGWIEKEENLSQEDDCWVSGDACVSGYADIESDDDFICITL